MTALGQTLASLAHQAHQTDTAAWTDRGRGETHQPVVRGAQEIASESATETETRRETKRGIESGRVIVRRIETGIEQAAGLTRSGRAVEAGECKQHIACLERGRLPVHMRRSQRGLHGMSVRERIFMVWLYVAAGNEIETRIRRLTGIGETTSVSAAAAGTRTERESVTETGSVTETRTGIERRAETRRRIETGARSQTRLRAVIRKGHDRALDPGHETATERGGDERQRSVAVCTPCSTFEAGAGRGL